MKVQACQFGPLFSLFDAVESVHLEEHKPYSVAKGVSISTYHPERGLEIYNFLLPPNNKHPFAAPA